MFKNLNPTISIIILVNAGNNFHEKRRKKSFVEQSSSSRKALKMLKFYYDLMSQPSRALYIFLKLNRLPVEYVKTDLMKMEHLTDEFKATNRFQKVPCIVDNDFKLSESVAIFRYLMQNKKESFDDHWYPNDIRTRALIDGNFKCPR